MWIKTWLESNVTKFSKSFSSLTSLYKSGNPFERYEFVRLFEEEEEFNIGKIVQKIFKNEWIDLSLDFSPPGTTPVQNSISWKTRRRYYDISKLIIP